MQTRRSALREALSYQRTLADAMPILVMMADPNGTVTFFNRAWFEYTGQTEFERDEHQDWRRYVHPDDVEGVAAGWAIGVLENRDVIEMEYRLREAKSGEYRWVNARATAMRDEFGEVLQWIGTAVDVQDAHLRARSISEVAEAYQAASLPFVAGTINGLRFCTKYVASTQNLSACGDWYDAFPLRGGRTAICIGDVGGHGLEAAILMAKYRMSLRAIAVRVLNAQTGGPETVLSSVEEALALESPEANATAFFGVISADRTQLHWSCAGHPPPLLLRKDGSMQWISACEPPLGWAFGVQRTAHVTSLENAHRLVLYTDGLVESGRNLVRGMEELQRRVAAAGEDDLAAHILDSWKPAPLADDVAVLTVRF